METCKTRTVCVQLFPLVEAQTVFVIFDDSAEIGNLVDQGLDLVGRAADLENDSQACSRIVKDPVARRLAFIEGGSISI